MVLTSEDIVFFALMHGRDSSLSVACQGGTMNRTCAADGIHRDGAPSASTLAVRDVPLYGSSEVHMNLARQLVAC